MAEAALSFLFALAFVGLAVYAIQTGQVRLRHGMRVRRAASPLAFWLFVAIYLIAAGFLVFLGLRAF
ncbi:MAG: hypothetical protein AABO58_11285 [Acidobacteriota bacterium]